MGGIELPPVSKLELYRINGRKIARFRREAKRQLRLRK
jgi:hypothetical protein